MSGLPEGWEERYDQSSGKNYYIDHNTHSTHWERPGPAQGPPRYGGDQYGAQQNRAAYPPPPQQSYGSPQQQGYRPPQQGYGSPQPPQSYGQGYGQSPSYSSPQQSERGSYNSQYPPPPQQGYGQQPERGSYNNQYPSPQQPGYGTPPPQQNAPVKKPGMSTGMKVALGAGAAGLVGLVAGGIYEHEKDENERIDRLEEREYENRGDYGYGGRGNGDRGYDDRGYDDRGYDDGYSRETVIDNGLFHDTKTVTETDGNGNTTEIIEKDGWFHDSTEVIETDRYGNEEVTEDDSWF